MQVVLDRLSRSLHSDVCDSDGCRDAVAHSRISGRGTRRSRAVPNYSTINGSLKPFVLLVLQRRLLAGSPSSCSDDFTSAIALNSKKVIE